MPVTSPRRPASVGQVSRDAAPGSVQDRQLPAIPPLGEPFDLNFSASPANSGASRNVQIKRAHLLDIVAERDEHGQRSPETMHILKQCGARIDASIYINDLEADPVSRPRSGSCVGQRGSEETPTKPERIDKARVASLVKELQQTETRYLQRISCLKNSYAAPLRKFAKRAETMIIPVYDANVMFANIDAVVESAERFCRDLQDVDLTGRVRDRNIGDVCLHHLKNLRTLECYRTYYDRQDESQRSFQSMSKRPSFETFTETVKYQTSGIGNIGIRELLAEPVQRIPRYTLLWQSMVDCMSRHDSQRAKLEECIVLASKIAKCETDERTKRATVMYCLERTVDGFPANLISNNRDFIDCIDVEDLLDNTARRPSLGTSASNPSFSRNTLSNSHRATSPYPSSSSASSSLNCTLILFDDKLVIVKRQHPTVNGRKTTGLDDLKAMLKGGGGLIGLAQSRAHLTKDKLSFKGVVDVLDVTALDIGAEADFQIRFDHQPADQTDKWAGRPVRTYTAVNPPLPPNMDIQASRRNKQRFVRNLWAAQALSRTKVSASAPKGSANAQGIGMPTAHMRDEQAVTRDGAAEAVTLHVNIWDRAAWMDSNRKAKTVLQLCAESGSPPLPLGRNNNPLTVISVRPRLDGLCGLSVMASQMSDVERENDVVNINDVLEEAVEIIDRRAAVETRSRSMSSQPTTPTSHGRHRSSILNLDTISRNLFGHHAHQSISSRSKSSVSRSSTVDSSRFSMDTKSTARTSMDSISAPSIPEKPSGYSPGRFTRSSTDYESQSLRPGSLDPPHPKALYAVNHEMDDSEADLEQRLNLAKANSISTNQFMRKADGNTITELGDVSVLRSSPPRGPLQIRNRTPSPVKIETEATTALEATMHTSPKQPSVLPLNLRRTPSPTRAIERNGVSPSRERSNASSPGLEREISSSSTLTRPFAASGPSRPLGPREPTVKRTRSLAPLRPPISDGRIVSGTGRRVSAGRERVPLKDDDSPSPQTAQEFLGVASMKAKRARSVEEMTPRKRSYDRHSKTITQLETDEDEEKGGSYKSTPSGSKRDKEPLRPSVRSNGVVTPLSRQTDETPSFGMDGIEPDYSDEKEHIKRAILQTRQVKHQLDRLSNSMGSKCATSKQLQTVLDESSASLTRSPPSRKLSKHATSTRDTSLSSRRTPSNASTSSKTDAVDAGFVQGWLTRSNATVEHVLASLAQAEAEKSELSGRLENAQEQVDMTSRQVESLQGRLVRATDKYDMAKAQIQDVTSELETVYEAFNVELDGLFNDASLPATEAFQALTAQLRETKAKRNELHLDNLRLQRELQDSNMKRDELIRLLKTHGK